MHVPLKLPSNPSPYHLPTEDIVPRPRERIKKNHFAVRKRLLAVKVIKQKSGDKDSGSSLPSTHCVT